MTKVKICGIQDLETAKIACNNGADFLGFVFAESKRQITPLKAKKIFDANIPPTIVGIAKSDTKPVIMYIIKTNK